jgi:hypothetical protein
VNRYVWIGLMLAAGTQLSMAQLGSQSTDVLGAHLNYGRGCTACHAPHSGSYGNGAARSGDATSGDVALWGEDASGLYGKTIATDGGKYVETLPTSTAAGTPDVGGILTCLTCHDGNFAQNAMMKNKVYEALPSTYGSAPVPTLLGVRGGSTGVYLSDHPMGLSATVSCGGPTGWDCAESNGEIHMNGPSASRFVTNYGFFVKPASYNNTAVIVCTTCHDPHAMSVVTITSGSASGLPAGTYATMFFLRGPYNPNDTNPMSNQTAQFCRQCHADKSNEMNGSSARTVF